MKKILVLACAVLMAVSTMAFAGPYFVLENEGMNLAPSLTVGADWETTLGDVFTGPSFGGDFSIGFDNILAPIAINNLWTTALNVDIDWGAVRCELAALLEINPRLYPNKVEITDNSYGAITVVGVPGDIVEVWGGVKLAYAPTNSRPDAWAPILFFGIEVHLD